MDTKIRRTLWSLLFVVMSIFSFVIWSAATSINILDKEQLQEQGILLFPEPRITPTVNLTDHKGNPFPNKNLQGKWTILFFGFTSCPDICPTTMGELNKIAAALSKQKLDYPVQYALVSIDPKKDTLKILSKYVTAFNKDFIGLRAEIGDVKKLAAALSVIVVSPQEEAMDHTQHQQSKAVAVVDEIDHSAQLVLINPAGNYHGFIQSGFNADKIVPLLPSVWATF